ncbi:hypothetical protein H0H93_015835 [Arthromyces matolae]|nr:hypothetical protein H0H93_015835 [Arthromyces matolae]
MSEHGESTEQIRPKQPRSRAIEFISQSTREEQVQPDPSAVGNTNPEGSSHPYKSSGTTGPTSSSSTVSQRTTGTSAITSEAYLAEQAVLKEVDSVTTSFEKGKITKPDAISKVVTLAYKLKTSELARQAAIVDFIGTIDSADKRAVSLRDRGQQIETTKDREGYGRSGTLSSTKDRHVDSDRNGSRLRLDSEHSEVYEVDEVLLGLFFASEIVPM